MGFLLTTKRLLVFKMVQGNHAEHTFKFDVKISHNLCRWDNSSTIFSAILSIRNKNLVLFPFDEQLCQFRMESYSMRSSQLKLAHWGSEMFFSICIIKIMIITLIILKRGKSLNSFEYHRGHTEDTVSLSKEIRIPAFEITGCYRDTNNCDRELATGAFSCVTVFLKLRRFCNYYLLNVYLPTGLCVIVSWTTFWIRLDIAPARVTLCKIYIIYYIWFVKATLLESFRQAKAILVTYISLISFFQAMFKKYKCYNLQSIKKLL